MSRVHVAIAVGAFAVYCGLASFVPPMDDELYYWCWSKDLQLSYYDHGPMTAYLIRLSTILFGDTLFAVRLPACVSTAFVLGVVLHLTRPGRLLPWLALTPLFTLGAVLVTPDTPLLMFWAAYVVWLVRVHAKLDAGEALPFKWWLLGGVLLGCGVLGKYTTGLAGIAGFLTFALAGGSRRWLAGYTLHGLVAFLVASPILLYNLAHDFAPLRYQWGHTMAQTQPGVKPFAEFVGVQVLLFGTLPLVVLPWAVWNGKRLAADPRLRVCLCLFGFPFVFFLVKAARGPLEGNWALASYIAFWPLAAAWWEEARQVNGRAWWPAGSFAAPGVVVLLAFAHLAHPIPLLPPDADRITRQWAKQTVADDIRAAVAARGEPLPVYVETYQMAALLRFHGIPATQIDGASRPSFFTLRAHDRPADRPRAYVVWEGTPKPGVIEGTYLTELVGSFPVVVRGQTKAFYTLLLYTTPAGMAAETASR